jgi:GNAT superfamily N-acetyltransferase
VQLEDVRELNMVFADSFTDRYRRDGMMGVRVPRLNPEIWRYAIRDAGAGAMLWRDPQGDIVAFNIAHHSGAEGWMGPLAVRPNRQGSGIGTVIVDTAATWLREQDVTTIGLETMPRTVDNIGFYSRLGFVPGHLTVTLTGESGASDQRVGVRLSQLSSSERDAMTLACRERLQCSAPGYDFTRELELTAELGVGDTVVIDDGGVRGFALWHSEALVESRPAEELRVLKIFADSGETFDRLVTALEACASQVGLGRLAIRCQTSSSSAYASLIEAGYRVRWTDLRMTLGGFPEPAVGDGEILLSNWEI